MGRARAVIALSAGLLVAVARVSSFEMPPAPHGRDDVNERPNRISYDRSDSCTSP